MDEQKAEDTKEEKLTFDELLKDESYKQAFDTAINKIINEKSTIFDNQLKEKDEILQTFQEKLKNHEEISSEFQTLQEQMKEMTNKHEEERQRQAYEFKLKELSNNIDFSSNGAKKYFITELLNTGLKTDRSGNILGFKDFVENYKKEDPTAFKTQEDTRPTPIFTTVSNNTVQKNTGEDIFGFNWSKQKKGAVN